MAGLHKNGHLFADEEEHLATTNSHQVSQSAPAHQQVEGRSSFLLH